MSVWKKLFNITPTQPNPLELAFLSQSKAIERIMAKQQELIAQQQNTLDRIVTARYDRPIQQTKPAERSAFPEFGLDDQGQVRPDDPIASAIDAISVESDEEFIARVAK